MTENFGSKEDAIRTNSGKIKYGNKKKNSAKDNKIDPEDKGRS